MGPRVMCWADPGAGRFACRVAMCSEFLEEDIETFFQWGQFPLEQCHLIVITE